MFTFPSTRACLEWATIPALFVLAARAPAAVQVYLDQGEYESALVASTIVDFEDVPDGEIIPIAAGHSWLGLVAGIDLYQVDANAQGYYGAPFLSDLVASTHYSHPVLFQLPEGTNAVGGQWFHAQTTEYDGHFTLTLEDTSTFDYVYENIATGRELNEPDFCGFVSPEQDIVSIEFHVEHDGNPAVSMADNVRFGYGTSLHACYADWNDRAKYFAGTFDAYAIVADDIQVAPGNEGETISEIVVEIMNWAANGANLNLLLYDDDTRTGLPGALLATIPLGHLGYGELQFVAVDGGGVAVPADGFLWVAVQADVSGAGWFIADRNPDIGASDDLVAVDEGGGFAYYDFGDDMISNMQLVMAVPGDACPADFDGDGDVDTADLLYLLGAWGTPDGDIDGDGDTDTADLLALLAAWGECP
jgi:hypothetical protein